MGKAREMDPCVPKGLFTWREEDPSTKKILEGGSS